MEPANLVVAVVENDPGMLKALGRLLRAAGYMAQLYASAELYLQRADHSDVACLILDIDLGGLSGIELQRMLVGSGTAPPIVFVTSQLDGGFEAAAQRLGCLAYLRKPFASQELLQALRRAFQP
ncbi:response regulator [Pseudoduganella sp. LjRoot289]|uniref:response regulator transcription factor n=1 Tax=Pseudoduganella sp. LjRoot289 TaxID=3342314 RepID=UPI003ECE79AB